jgi:hypothetical protein
MDPLSLEFHSIDRRSYLLASGRGFLRRWPARPGRPPFRPGGFNQRKRPQLWTGAVKSRTICVMLTQDRVQSFERGKQSVFSLDEPLLFGDCGPIMRAWQKASTELSTD